MARNVLAFWNSIILLGMIETETVTLLMGKEGSV